MERPPLWGYDQRFPQKSLVHTTPHGSYYDDKTKNSPEEKDWIVKLNQAVLRYPGSNHNSQQQQYPLDLEIQAAGVSGGHALLGPNSSGKSLLVAALAALGGPDDDDNNPHLLDPSSIQHSGPLLRRLSVARVSFESHQALLHTAGSGSMSTYGALTPGGGQLTKAAQFLVVRFGLYSLLTRDVTTLSTGEIRKVLLIRALSQGPRLLVLDNAFDGLDVASREVLKELVSKTIRGFRADILVQGVDVKAVARTQVLLATHRAEEIVDDVSTVTVLGAGPAVAKARNGRTADELISEAVGDAASNMGMCEPLLPSAEEIAQLWNHDNNARPNDG